MRRPIGVLFLVGSIASACGGDSPTTPTPGESRIFTSSESEGTIAANGSACASFRVGWQGTVTIDASPLGFTMEAGSGNCTAPINVLATSTNGSISIVMQPGDAFVRLRHAGQNDTRYRLVLRYPF